MKKLALGLLTAVLVAFGFTGVSSAPAQAFECPYTGCYGTTTELTGKNRVWVGRSPRYRVQVLPLGTEDSVQGEVDLMFYRNGRFKAVKTSSEPYNGEPIRMQPAKPLNRRGIWTVVAQFHTEDGPFYPSQDTVVTRVVKRR